MSEAIAGPLRAALVGLTAPHSRGWLETLLSLPEVGRLWVCDVDAAGDRGPEAARAELPERAQPVSVDALLDAGTRPDLALLSLRNDQAPDVGARLLAAGIPCIIEKPGGRSSVDIARLNDAARDGSTIWAPGFLNRLQPAARRIRRLVVREGALGRIVSVEARMVTSSVRQRNPEHWLFSKQAAGGGILHWLAIHTIDLIRYLTGQEYASVSAYTATLSRTGIDVEDMAAVCFALTGGAVGSLHAGYVLRQRYGDIGLTLRGDLGEIVWPQWDFDGRQDRVYIHSEGPVSEGPGAEVVTLTSPEGPGYGGGLGQEFVRRFAAAVRMGAGGGGRTAFVTDGIDALKAMQFVEAAYTASASGQRVTPGAPA